MHEAEATPLRRWPEREQTMRTAPAQSGTAYAVSPDSDLHWTTGGAWYVERGVYRIPLPLPLDALKAVNVYVIETLEGLVLIDGGWAIIEARELLHRSLASIGYGFGDIRRFLVTHAHRDHFTLATVLGREFGADVALGLGEKPTLELLTDAQAMETNPSPQFCAQQVRTMSPPNGPQRANTATFQTQCTGRHRQPGSTVIRNWCLTGTGRSGRSIPRAIHRGTTSLRT
jgi:hypothetical protein